MPSFTTAVSNLHRIGPVIEVIISLPRDLIQVLKQQNGKIPSSIRAMAMIDTGATYCVVNPEIIRHLKLNPIDSIYANTTSSVNVKCFRYKAAINFPADFAVETSNIIEMPLKNQHIQCLIGRDVLKRGVLIYNGYTETVTFSV